MNRLSAYRHVGPLQCLLLDALISVCYVNMHIHSGYSRKREKDAVACLKKVPLQSSNKKANQVH